jgi:hypothetical protein
MRNFVFSIIHGISTRMRCRERVTRMVEIRNAYKMLVVKSEGNGPFGRHRSGLEAKIKIDLKRSST